MCFSEHGGTLLMSWRSWPEPVRNLSFTAVELVGLGRPIELNSSIFGNMKGSLYRNISIFWRKEVVPGTGPGVLSSGDPRSLLAGTRRPVSCLGSGGIQYMSSFPIKTPKPRPEVGPWKPEAGPWKPEARTRSQSRNLEAGAGTNMVFFIGLRELHRSIKFLIEFGVGRRLVAWAIKLPYEMLPPWLGLAGVGRKLDGEVGNVCIKGDASSHTPDTCAASVAILGLRILRGRILARLGIRGMRRFNKTRSPKLRILMLDSAGLACASWAWGTFGMFFLVPGDNLVDSWYRSRSLGHVVCGEQ
ncbi:hypothetical protein F2Q68_00021231 [Brassica cretica]|uniref:Uncharacterized protein n=1 Tax=Brassica cretica TaxID=69181 RepID=A0A8S9FN21_BRACR|nr:hypothetical protein F2Q68_00021231 [Brassica cretica]